RVALRQNCARFHSRIGRAHEQGRCDDRVCGTARHCGDEPDFGGVHREFFAITIIGNSDYRLARRIFPEKIRVYLSSSVVPFFSANSTAVSKMTGSTIAGRGSVSGREPNSGAAAFANEARMPGSREKSAI